MSRVPQSKLITADKVRTYLDSKHGADFTCPLTAGIFINIAANASEERKGARERTYWRTLKRTANFRRNIRAVSRDANKTRNGRHKIIQKGKRYLVEGYEKDLFDQIKSISQLSNKSYMKILWAMAQMFNI